MLGLATATTATSPNELYSSSSTVSTVPRFDLRATHRVVPDGRSRKPVLFIWLGGGVSHIDSFCPLPGAPENIRGPFNSIPTRVPGLRISDQLPLMARRIHETALLKNIYHTEPEHRLATNIAFTGSDSQNVERVPIYKPFTTRFDKYLSDNNLGRHMIFKTHYGNFYEAMGAYDSLIVYRNKNENNTYRDPDRPYWSPFGEDVDIERLQGQTALLGRLNSARNLRGPQFDRWDELVRGAVSMSVGDLNKAFDLSRVEPRVRDRYPNTDFGNSALIASRLIDVGAQFITLSDDRWDDHSEIERELKVKLPELDRILASLIDDLGDRAVIVVASEFGRLPRQTHTDGRAPGRNHWPFSNFMLVHGIGQKVIGELDNSGRIRGTAFDAKLLGPTIFKLAGYELVEERSDRELTNYAMPYYPIV